MPTLRWRCPTMDELRTIVCALDFSPCSREALRMATVLAFNLDARLYLLHVLDAGQTPEAIDPAAPASAEPAAADDMALAKRRLAAEMLPAVWPGLKVRALVSQGPAADRILELADSRRAGLIVLGASGRGGMARESLGRVADQVLRMAPCPVLAVRQPGSAMVPARA